MICRREVGRTYGLNPKILLWLYTVVVRPASTYGAIVCWTRIQVQTVTKKLASVQKEGWPAW